MRIFVLLSLIPFISAKELIAEVRNIPDKCGLDNKVQYWINTASAARESTLQIVGGDFKLASLDVSGQASFGSTRFTTVEFDHLIENEHDGGDSPILSTFKKQVRFEGGIALNCPKRGCTMKAASSEATSLRLENMDLVIGATSVGETIMKLLGRIEKLEEKAGIYGN